MPDLSISKGQILSIFKDLYHADEYMLLDEERQLLYSYLLVLNKYVPSPLCCLPST